MKQRKPDLSTYEGLPDSSLLDSDSVMIVFGYTGKSWYKYVKENRIPKPDIKSGCDPYSSNHKSIFKAGKRTAFKHRAFWALGSLRKLLNE